jgi:hypothetical protein
MAGTLTISTLSDGTNSTSSTNCIQGSAKAWVNYKGTSTQSIRASYNVSSVTYNSTGNYTVNFTNAFSDTNYCFQGNGAAGSETSANASRCVIPITYNTTSVQVVTLFGAGASTGFIYVNVACFR